MPAISDELASDLRLLSQLPSDEEVKEFCKMSTQIFLQGQLQNSDKFKGNFISKKILEKAAAKLSIEDPEKIDNCIGAIAYLYNEAAKFQASPEHLAKDLQNAGISFYEIVSCHFAENQDSFQEFISKNSESFLFLFHYSKLDWRLDCVIASRCKMDQVTPMFTLKLETKSKAGKLDSHFFQTDPVNLIHITNVLENALAELKSKEVKKIQKFL
jgi:hypothetical protein